MTESELRKAMHEIYERSDLKNLEAMKMENGDSISICLITIATFDEEDNNTDVIEIAV